MKKEFDFKPLPAFSISQPEEEKQLELGKEVVGALNVIIDKRIIERLKDYAYWERITHKEVVIKALEQFFSDKQIKVRPKGR